MELQNLDWSDVQSANEDNDAYNIFVSWFFKIYDEIIPILNLKEWNPILIPINHG